MNWSVIEGGCARVLTGMEAETVDCVVTRPPYWQQRDYHVDGQLGVERTPREYVERLVVIFHELRRVLKKGGTFWLVLGDKYANDGKWGGETGGKQAYLPDDDRKRTGREKVVTGLKAKDLIGIPWEVAFALRDECGLLGCEVV